MDQLTPTTDYTELMLQQMRGSGAMVGAGASGTYTLTGEAAAATSTTKIPWMLILGAGVLAFLLFRG